MSSWHPRPKKPFVETVIEFVEKALEKYGEFLEYLLIKISK